LFSLATSSFSGVTVYLQPAVSQQWGEFVFDIDIWQRGINDRDKEGYTHASYSEVASS
jgi:hypothetical protein